MDITIKLTDDQAIEYLSDKNDQREVIKAQIQEQLSFEVYDATSKKKLYSLLKEDAAYLVDVMLAPSNIPHRAILLTGLSNGAYWKLDSSGYEQAVEFREVYRIKVIKFLTSKASGFSDEIPEPESVKE